MADGTTANFGFVLPEVGLSYNTWGEKLNQNWEDLDADLAAIKPGQLAGGGTGLQVAVDANTFAARSIAVSAGLSIANANGAAGNPTVSLTPTGLTAKALPVDADEVVITDSAASFAPRKATRLNLLKQANHTAPRTVFSNLGVPSGSVALDLATSNHFLVEVNTAAKSILTQNGPTGVSMEITLVLTLGASGSVNFVNDTWLWPGGAVPTFTVGGTDVLKLLWTGDGANTILAWRVATDVR